MAAATKKDAITGEASFIAAATGRTLSTLLRRGRFAVYATDQIGTIIAVKATTSLAGSSAQLGPAANVLAQANLPVSLVAAWNLGTSGETDVDPVDAPTEPTPQVVGAST